MGSGTTNRVSAKLGRNSVGYEIDLELLEVVKAKMGLSKDLLFGVDYEVEIIVRDEARHLRTFLQEKVANKTSVKDIDQSAGKGG